MLIEFQSRMSFPYLCDSPTQSGCIFSNWVSISNELPLPLRHRLDLIPLGLDRGFNLE